MKKILLHNLFIVIVLILAIISLILLIEPCKNYWSNFPVWSEMLENSPNDMVVKEMKEMCLKLALFCTISAISCLTISIISLIMLTKLNFRKAIEISQEQQSKKFRKNQEIKEQKITQKIKELEKELNDLQK